VIYPARRAAALAVAGGAAALGLALASPSLWVSGPVWFLALVGLIGIDGLLAAPARAVRFALDAPHDLPAPDGVVQAMLTVIFERRPPTGGVETALQVNAKLALSPPRVRAERSSDGQASAAYRLRPVRRGEGRVERAWARWTGPLGLLTIQASAPLDHLVRVVPDLGAVREEAMRLFARNALLGSKSRPDTGDGFEFQALKEYAPGMDLRAIDWKQSARHGLLLSKEFRLERNHPIMLALDSGRLMGEPTGGAPKLDRALNSALLIGYVALTLGDRVGLAAFDSRPRQVARPVAGRAAFLTLQRLAAAIDYGAEETNFTLGLSAVGEGLDRRALIVVFTDFADPTSAQLMLESAGRLARRHLLLFVLFEDAELEAARAKPPAEAADVSRAVVADALLRERAVVVAGLRRLGAEVVEAPAAEIGTALLDRYLTLKRLDRL
jgi:uncharacterized protein (DUF58 family)